MHDTASNKKEWFKPVSLSIDRKKTAYLSMDLSVSALKGERSRVSTLGKHAEEQNLLINCKKTLEASRATGVYVVHVRVAFRPGYPEYSEEASPFWKKVKESGAYVEGTPEVDLCEEVAPIGEEPVITKSTVDPFLYSDLDRMLRVRGITTLVLTGIATSNVSEGTVRAASDRGYVPVVLEDCVADYNEEMHKFQIQHLLPMHAFVSNSAQYLKALGGV